MPDDKSSEHDVKSLLADAAAGWDTCEKRRLQAEEFRARAHFAESLLLRSGINGELMQAYARVFPLPTPESLPGVVEDV